MAMQSPFFNKREPDAFGQRKPGSPPAVAHFARFDKGKNGTLHAASPQIRACFCQS